MKSKLYYDQKKKKEVLLMNVNLGVTDWSCEESANWIEFIGYPQYKRVFLKYRISGSVLIQLTEDDLRYFLFIPNDNDILRILVMIKNISK